MKCIHCDYENEGDFCLKCHKLIRYEYLPKDELKDKTKNYIDLYFKMIDYDILTKNYSLKSFLLGPFYSSYYKAYLTTLFGILLDTIILYFYANPITLAYYLGAFYLIGTIIFRYLVYMTFQNTFMRLELGQRVKRMIRDSKDDNYIKEYKKSSIIYPFLTLAIYVFILLIGFKYF